ncbi:hypothetical protein NP493_2056g00002 [Ridgeia piscesae]|uniref:Uncharacterized protein n=1 Tax=Ridgeia piscesae TaxID=27915 RepID=A0AAD9JMB9_RIDPI|nr:hypothetical protein NP493_2056g00002 [Ridgeia piscesae]
MAQKLSSRPLCSRCPDKCPPRTDVRSRESSCCSPPSPSPPPREIQNAACRHNHRRSQICRRQHHAFTHPPAPPRSPFNSHRNATSPKR